MGLTITEKILLAHTRGVSSKKMHPGEFILADVDFTLGNDITAPLAIQEFKKLKIKKVFNKNRIALIPDHFLPARDFVSANAGRCLKDFAQEQNIKHYYEIGRMGIEHALLPELGLIKPGELIVGADSHTCTYGALGAFSTGVGSTDLAASWALGKCWFKVPETIQFVYEGTRNRWVTGKDLILYTIGDIGVDGARYKAMEFTGSVIRSLPVDDRFTICNMAIEAGGKSGIIEPDNVTFEYLREVLPNFSALAWKKKAKAWSNLRSDKDARYSEIKKYNVSKWEPVVSCPHLPSNTKPVGALKNVKLDQVVIGSCTNGHFSDLRIAANILRKRRIHPKLRLIVIPATQKIYLQAAKEGLAEIFVKAGGVFSTPTCGPCLGGHCGVLTKGEVALATTNRNFIGRMGDPGSFVYLSNPAVAAASAIKGRIAHPEEVV
ncbi:3-isopropylmalate dehydratase large subunit [Candidatus Omnitrophota bacterium]